jgi:hypothetical protein
MPEDVITKLGQFTPLSGLDRDELLFRAGRASAPSARVWKLATGLLATGLLATVAVWVGGPSPEPIVVRVPVDAHDTPFAEPATAPSPVGQPGASSYFVMSRSVSEGMLPAPEPPGDSPTVAPVVLTAGSHGVLE